MARVAVAQHGVAISLACTAFGVSETSYRYQAKLQAKNEKIANWLIRLPYNNQNWGFGLCYLYLSIKPNKRMVRERPATLTVPASINQVWSMDHERPNMALGGFTPKQRLTMDA